MSLTFGGTIKNGSVTEIVSGGVSDHAAVAAASSFEVSTWLLLFPTPATNQQLRTANVVTKKIGLTAVVTHVGEFMNDFQQLRTRLFSESKCWNTFSTFLSIFFK